MSVAAGPQPQAATGTTIPTKVAALFDRVRNAQFPPQARPAVSIVSALLLVGAVVLLVWGMWSAVAYTLTNTGPPCSNPPQREAYPPQWIVVGVCLIAFVFGHLSARWQLILPEHTQRHREDDEEHPELDVRKREALIIQSLLLVFLLEVTGLLIIEAVTLARGVWPITYYVRCAYDAAGLQSMATAASIVFLVGRWFWLPARGKRARSGS